MPKEIERKFLVEGDGWRSDVSRARRFEQAIVFADGARNLRIRLADGESATLTVKIDIDGSSLSRHEFEYEIPFADGAEMLALASGGRISKTRHDVPHRGHVWEVDVYHGALEGLIIAEVELANEDEAPLIPDWLGRELTGDRRFSNQALAEGSLGDDWRNGI